MLVLPLINFLIANLNTYPYAGATGGAGSAVLSQLPNGNATSQRWTILSLPEGYAIRSAAEPDLYASAVQTSTIDTSFSTVQLNPMPYFWQIVEGPSTFPNSYYIRTSDGSWNWDQKLSGTTNDVEIILQSQNNPPTTNQLWCFIVPWE